MFYGIGLSFGDSRPCPWRNCSWSCVGGGQLQSTEARSMPIDRAAVARGINHLIQMIVSRTAHKALDSHSQQPSIETAVQSKKYIQ